MDALMDPGYLDHKEGAGGQETTVGAVKNTAGIFES